MRCPHVNQLTRLNDQNARNSDTDDFGVVPVSENGWCSKSDHRRFVHFLTPSCYSLRSA